MKPLSDFVRSIAFGKKSSASRFAPSAARHRSPLQLLALEQRILLDAAATALPEALGGTSFEYIPGYVLVGFDPLRVNDPLGLLSGLQSSSLQRQYKTFDAIEIKLPEGMSVEDGLSYFSGFPGVTYAEPNYVRHALATTPDDTSYDSLWGMNNTGQTGGTAGDDINAPQAWDFTTGSTSVVVGIIDSGIDITHPDLAGNIWINPGEIPDNQLDDDGNGYIDDMHGWNFVENNNDISDGAGHGTHVAGTIGAVGNNAIGVTGVNWSVELVGLRILNDDGYSMDDATIAAAIDYATMMDISITNNSWGGGGFSKTIFDAIAAAGQEGYLFIAAAGNDSNNNDVIPSYSDSYNLSNIISVAATDDNDSLAYFSNYGRTEVDIAAPGVHVFSTLPMDGSRMGAEYGYADGTSMATPHVTGVAALLKAIDPSLTGSEIRAAIVDGADKVDGLEGIVRSGGRLDAYRSLRLVAQHDPWVVSNSPDGIALNSASSVNIVFSMPMDTTSFSIAQDVHRFTGPSGNITVSSYTWVDNKTLRINFPSQVTSGQYQLVLGPDILSATGDALDQNGNGVSGETDGDAYAASFSLATAVYSTNMTTNPGWTLDSGNFPYEWAYGQPTGYGDDPNSGHTGDNVIGYNLHGYYPGFLPSPEYATTPAIDCSSMGIVVLDFYRWLNVRQYGNASVQVSNDGANWTTVWESGDGGESEDYWTHVQYDISGIAAFEDTVYVRWGMESFDWTGDGGWNIDDVTVAGVTAPDVRGAAVLRQMPNSLLVEKPPTSFQFAFGERMDTSSFSLADVAGFAGPDGDLTDTITGFSWSDDRTLNVFFDEPTSDGTYEMTLGTDILDLAGNQMDQNRNGTNGEAADQYSASFVFDSLAPRTQISLQAASDTGLSDSDLLTNDTTPTFDVAVNKAGVIDIDWNNDGVFDETQVSSGAGTYEFTLDSPMVGDGEHTVAVKFTDVFGVIGTSQETITLDTVAPVVSSVEGTRIIFKDTFATDLGWTGYSSTTWQRGSATSGGGQYGNPDPALDTTATSDNDILGFMIGGDYQNGISSTQWITSPAIDASLATNVAISFESWLNVEGPKFDHAYLQVFDGSAWHMIYSNTAGVEDSSWQDMQFDVSEYADGNANFRVRFGIGPTDSSRRYSGWNIDDFDVRGLESLPSGGQTNVEIAFDSLSLTFVEEHALTEGNIVNPSSYQLVASGGDGVFGNGNDEDVSSLFGTISYSGITKMAVIPLTSALQDDTYRFTVFGSAGIEDSAGNQLNNGNDTVRIISVESTYPTIAIDMQTASDSGISNSDDITNDTTPTYDVTVNKAGTVALAWQKNGSYVAVPVVWADDAGPVIAEAGAYSFTPVSPLADGVYTVTARFTGLSLNYDTDIIRTTIDTAAPAAPHAPTIAVADDTGVKGDHLTADRTPQLNFVLPAGSYYRLYRDGVDISQYAQLGDDGGVYVVGSSVTLITQPFGEWDYTVSAVDAAGNESAPSPAFDLTISGFWPIASHTYLDGATVTIYDTDPTNGISAPAIAWSRYAFQKGATDILVTAGSMDGIISSITIYGNGARTSDLGFIIENNAILKSFTDKRSTGEPISFIYSEGTLAKVTLPRGITGANLNNGFITETGWTLPDDIDHDGNLNDLTAVYSGGSITNLKAGVVVGGDTYAAGNISLLRAYAPITADVTAAGRIGKLYAYSGLSGNVTALNGLGTLQVKGVLSGDVSVTGNLRQLIARNLGGTAISGDVNVYNGNISKITAIGSITGAGISAENGRIGSITVRGDYSYSSIFANRLGPIRVSGYISGDGETNVIRALDNTSSFRLRDRALRSLVSSAHNYIDYDGVLAFVGDEVI